MNLNEMKHKYAYMLARVGLNVQKGQTVLVEACVEGAAFTPIFAEECYKLGAGNVVIHYLDMANMAVAAQYRDLKDVQAVEDWEVAQCEKYLEEGACFVRLEGVNPALMENVSEDKASAVFAHIDTVRNVMRRYSRERHCQWLIAMIPTQEWADYILPDVAKEERLNTLWYKLFDLCYLTEDNDPVETWKNNQAKKAARGKKLDSYNFRKLHYTAGNGTDLTVTLTPYSKYYNDRSGDPNRVEYLPNLPTEEIATTPEKYGTDGVVYSSRPLILGGKAISDFGFRFEHGKVVEVIAGEGKEMLEAIVNTDEGSAYLGEAALVEYHSPISMSGLVYYTTLIDENASCHLALGNGFLPPLPEGWTANKSSKHIDFMIGTPDMHITGITDDGTEVTVFENGDFAAEFAA